MANVLVVCASPGDEVLGCGGTLARHARRGDTVRVLVLGDGWTSRVRSAEKGFEALDLDVLEEQSRSALARLGVETISYLRFPDNRFDTLALLDIVKTIEDAKRDFDADVVYTNSPYDLSVDQRFTVEAVLTAFRPLPGDNKATLMAFEVLSSTEWNQTGGRQGFAPNCFVDISDTLADKLAAYRAIYSEQRPWPHARSIEALEHLARSRGAAVGLEAAEAFLLLREVTRLDAP
jgi:LmbE family N-acetylglucosaminyl deacetylase